MAIHVSINLCTLGNVLIISYFHIHIFAVTVDISPCGPNDRVYINILKKTLHYIRVT